MNIYLDLFLTFLKIGAFSFGGGYGMISFVREEVLLHAWLSESEFVNMIAVAESTPGPIAVNMATFIGSSQAGILGSILATLGVVLPSFIIILVIVSLAHNLLKLAGVKAFLHGVRPVIAGLIVATSLTLFLSGAFQFKNLSSNISIDFLSLIILALVVLSSLLYKKVFKKKPSAILLIIISAILGIILYSI